MLYISTTTGSVLRYNLATNTFLTPYTLGGSLAGMDISPDGKTLVVADGAYGATTNHIDVINLANGSSQQIPFTLGFGEAGTYSVAFTSDSSVLVSLNYAGSGWVPMRLVNLTTGTSTTVDSIRQSLMLTPSADHSVVAFEESNISSGPVERYRVSDGNIAGTSTNWFTFEVGVNRNGTQYAAPTYDGTFMFDQNFNSLATIGTYANTMPIGVAYSPTSNVVYFAWASNGSSHEVVDAYSTTTFQPVQTLDSSQAFAWPGNAAFVNGRLKVSSDGSVLFCTTTNGVYDTMWAIFP